VQGQTQTQTKMGEPQRRQKNIPITMPEITNVRFEGMFCWRREVNRKHLD